MSLSQKSIRIIFSDMDGTLLHPSHALSEYTRLVLDNLRTHNESEKEKVYFVLATGRPSSDVLETVRNHRIAADFIITHNGASLYNSLGEPIVQHCLSPSLVKRLLSLGCNKTFHQNAPAGAPLAFATSWFQGKEWFTNYKIEGLGGSYPPHFQPQLKYHQWREVEAVLENVSESELERIPQLFYYGPHEALIAVESELRRHGEFSGQIDVSFSLPFLLDVSPHGVHKGMAVREVLQRVGLCVEQSAAFGDGMNDLSMLEAVGTPFVMKNSMPALRSALPAAEVVESNMDDGVAKKMVQLFPSLAPL